MSIVKVDPLVRPVVVSVISSVSTQISVGFGVPGPTGPAGPRSVYYQSVDPGYTANQYIWFETDVSGDIINMWVNDGQP